MKFVTVHRPDGIKYLLRKDNVKSVGEYWTYDRVEDGELDKIVGELTFWQRVFNKLGANIEPEIKYEKRYKYINQRKICFVTMKDKEQITGIIDNIDYLKEQLESE
jgi:hypothetical protein